MSGPGVRDVWPSYLRIGLLSFGGPAGQIALMQEEIVERRGWVSSQTFQNGLNVAMLLPGPEAQQLATWLGWRLHGVAGGMLAGLAFVLPGAALMIALAWISAAYGEARWVAAVFYGIQAAVLVVVVRALWALARRSLVAWPRWVIAGLAFVGIWALGVPFPLIVLLAAVAGLFLRVETPAQSTPAAPGQMRRLVRVVGTGLGLILLVYIAVRLVFGTDPFDGIATLFTSAAFVSFGGAYALLPYVADRAVDSYGWLTAPQMLNGLALAESTPGPLILVTVYAGFFAGWPMGGWSGVLTASLACFYTFAPSFMLILGVAPMVETVQRIGWIRKALAGVSAAVVGVVLNLAVYLGTAALFPVGLEAPEWPKIALLLSLGALALWRALPMTTLIAMGAGAGPMLALAGVI